MYGSFASPHKTLFCSQAINLIIWASWMSTPGFSAQFQDMCDDLVQHIVATKLPVTSACNFWSHAHSITFLI
jgi:hypothetical protein